MKPEEKIYRAYFDSKKQTLYFNEIKEITKLSDSSLSNTLKNLVKENILTKNKTKSNTYYQIKEKKIIPLKFSEIAVHKFQNLNINVKIPILHFLTNIPDDIYTIILFGSASRKEENKKSDIDLLIVSNKKIDLSAHKKKAEITSKFPISIFSSTIKQFKQSQEDIIIQAKKTGFPIYREQNFYEVIINEY